VTSRAYHAAVAPGADTTHIASDLGLVIGRLTRRLRAEHSFSMAQAAVLGRLSREGTRTTSALALAERVKPQSMAQTLAELAGEGFIARRPDPDDRRQTLIELTPLGRETLERERERREGWLAQGIDEALSPEERAIIAEAVPLLGRLADL
jgi:DNA-binding MarR family transcriptional regulator